MTNFFLDAEFIEDGKTIELISIGIVSERDTHLYKANEECPFARANDWVKKNVIPQLPHLHAESGYPLRRKIWGSRAEIREDIEQFVRMHEPPYRFWAYFADYDWVVSCWLWGRMIDLPDGFPFYCLDLKQEMVRLGVERDELPSVEEAGGGAEHDALADARWNLRVWRMLKERGGCDW